VTGFGLGHNSSIISSYESSIQAVDTKNNFYRGYSQLPTCNVIIGAVSGVIEQNISDLDWANSSKNTSENNIILGGIHSKITNQACSTLIANGWATGGGGYQNNGQAPGYTAHTGFDHALKENDTKRRTLLYGVPGHTITIGAPRGTFVTGSLYVIGDGGLNLDLDYLPTSDPSIRGQVYVDGGTLKVSL